MTHRVLTQIALLLLVSMPLAAQQYYRWVDENGTMHFSENPPPDNAGAAPEQVRASHLTRGLSGNSDATDGTAQNAVANSAAGNQNAGAANDEEMCRKVRTNLETLRNTPQVRRVDPDTGEARLLSDDEHQQELERNLRLEDQYC